MFILIICLNLYQNRRMLIMEHDENKIEELSNKIDNLENMLKCMDKKLCAIGEMIESHHSDPEHAKHHEGQGHQ